MPCNRTELEKRERQFLAPYAQFSADSRGRVHDENPRSFARSISVTGTGSSTRGRSGVSNTRRRFSSTEPATICGRG